MEDLSLSTLVWLRMVRFVENSNQLSNDHLRQFDLTLAQFEALAHIRNFQPITQTDLARGLTVWEVASPECSPVSNPRAHLEAAGLEDQAHLADRQGHRAPRAGLSFPA